MNPESKPAELSAEELEMLKAFIAKKGFGEPVVLHEILDHFACKVEELRAEFPKKAFTDIMHEAHRSFGVSGFYPLVKSFHEGLETDYRRYFKKRLRAIAGFGMEPQDRRRAGWVIAALGAVWAFQELCFRVLYPMAGDDWKEICTGIVLACFMAVDFLRIYKFTRRPNPFVIAAQQAAFRSSPVLVCAWVLCVNIPKVPAFQIGLMIFVALFAWLQQARYATIDKALEDYWMRMEML